MLSSNQREQVVRSTGAPSGRPLFFEEDRWDETQHNRRRRQREEQDRDQKNQIAPEADSAKAGKTKAGEKEVIEVDDDRLTMVRKLIVKWATDIQAANGKPGVAELTRLLALEKELSEGRETVREIKVTWVEPSPTESSKSE